MLPEYSFRVDLPKTDSAPPLRTLNQPGMIQTEALIYLLSTNIHFIPLKGCPWQIG